MGRKGYDDQCDYPESKNVIGEDEHSGSVPLIGRAVISNLGWLKQRCFGSMGISLLIVMMLLPNTAHAAGIRHIVIPADGNEPKLLAEIWTPCGTSAPAIVVDRNGFQRRCM